MFLEQMPPELVGQFLDFDLVRYASIYLWMTGNLNLQSKLARSVTQVELINEKSMVLLTLPKMLTELRKLEVLYVNRLGMPLIMSKNVGAALAGLNPGLRELKLHFADSSQILSDYCFQVETLPPSTISQGDKTSQQPSTTQKRYKFRFSQLERLELDDRRTLYIEHLKALPSTLQHFSGSIKLQPSAFVSYAAAFPRSLTSCRLVSSVELTLPFLENLPTGLRTLQLDSINYPPSNAAIAAMPRNLTNLFLETPAPTWTSATAAAFPPEIQNLTLRDIENNTPLPDSLTTLRLGRDFRETFRLDATALALLPRSLTSLESLINWRNLAKDALPPGLKILRSLKCLGIKKEQLALLPPTLTELLIDEIDYESISTLPRGLKILSAPINTDTLASLPPAFPIEFPPFLEVLSLTCAPMTIFCFLPTTLTSFTCQVRHDDKCSFVDNDMIITSRIGASHPRVLKRLQEVKLELARQVDIEDDDDEEEESITPPGKLSLLGFLPRSLRVLTLPNFECAAWELKQLPQTLTNLTLGEVPHSFMRDFSKLKLRTLRCKTFTTTNEHYILMPRTMEQYTINAVRNDVTADAAPFVPIHILTGFQAGTSAGGRAYRDLVEKRRLAHEEEDVEKLRSLCTPPEVNL